MITLDGKKLIELKLRDLGGSTPMAPDFENYTLQISGHDGEYDFGMGLKSRPFTRKVAFIDELSYDDLGKARRDLIAFLFNSRGKAKTMKMIFDYELDKYYSVRLSNGFTPENILFMDFFELPFIAFDPYAYFVTPSNGIVMDSDIPIQSDVIMDTGIGSYNVIEPQTIQIINNGTITIRASLTIEGSGDDVTFSANGRSFNLGSFTDDIWVIDGDKYNITKNDVVNLSPFSNGGNPIDLLPGSNDVTIAGSNLNLTITENLRYKYL